MRASHGLERREGSLRLAKIAKTPRVRRGIIFLLLLAGAAFLCLGSLLALPATSLSPSSSEVVAGAPSAVVGTNDGVGHSYGGASEASAPVQEVGYPLLSPAEEVREMEKGPVNAELLGGLALAMASFFFGVGALWLLATNARGRAARDAWGLGDDPRLSTATRVGASLLGVFLL